MRTRITIEQLEQMRTHELADLLANISMLLRRVPDVVYSQLIPPIPGDEVYMPHEAVRRSLATSDFTEADLKKKSVAELKEMAKERFISHPGNIKKDDLIAKILARPANGHSEQFVIAELKDVPSEPTQQSSPGPTLTQAELKKKSVAELKEMAKERFIPLSGNVKKDDLIRKILARAASGHSEQFAILDL